MSGKHLKIARLTEAFLWTAGALLLGWVALSGARAALAQKQALKVVNQWQVNQGQVNPEQGDHVQIDAPEDPDRSLWSAQRKRAHELAKTQSGAVKPLAALSIPALDLRVAVFAGTSETVLDLGAGWLESSAQIGSNGHIALAAHRDGYFRGLRNIAVGDELQVQSPQGTAHYTVTEIRIVYPHDVSVLLPPDAPMLTLITCYPFYFVGAAPQRFIVQAELTTRHSELMTMKPGEIDE